MLENIIIEPASPAQYAVVWLHGLGADGYDFVPVAEQLHQQTHLPIRFIFPHARLRPVTLNGGYVMRAWYDIHGLDIKSREDKEGLQETAQAVGELIQQQIDGGISSQHIFLGGFSQGGATSLYTGLRTTHHLAGIISFSAYLPLRDQLVAQAHPANKTTPLFIAHGSQDMVVPFAWGELSYQILNELGYPVTWKSYPMAHQVSAEQLVDLIEWMKAIVDK